VQRIERPKCFTANFILGGIERRMSKNHTLPDDVLLFTHREIRAKDVFYIQEISKTEAYDFVRKYHYLGDAKFFCEQAFGLFAIHGDQLLGVATFSQPQGIVALKGWFGLTNQDKCVYELSRLCLSPALNKTNATSFLLGGSLKALKKQRKIKAVITLADSSRHVGSIYQVCNFKYYGLTDAKTDFFCADGRVNPRGSTKELHGVWIPRTRKHRYAYILDPKLKVQYPEQPKPGVEDTVTLNCCFGLEQVFDNRYKEWFTCPHCTGKFELINS
jgi:hypothetical protein